MPKKKIEVKKEAVKEVIAKEENPIEVIEEKPKEKTDKLVGKKIGGKEIVSVVDSTIKAGFKVVYTTDNVGYTLSVRDIEEQVK